MFTYEALISSAFYSLVFILAGCLALRHYYKTISRKEWLLTQQYRLFALRDRALRLLGDGVVREDDVIWWNLYEHLNNTAKRSTLESMFDDDAFAYALLSQEPPGGPNGFREVPESLRKLWLDYKQTVSEICSDVLTSSGPADDHRSHRKMDSTAVRETLRKRNREKEATNFEKWSSTTSVGHAAS